MQELLSASPCHTCFTLPSHIPLSSVNSLCETPVFFSLLLPALVCIPTDERDLGRVKGLAVSSWGSWGPCGHALPLQEAPLLARAEGTRPLCGMKLVCVRRKT